MSYQLCICIPTYNRAKHLRNCLASIQSIPEVDRRGVQICISDNHSIDNTPEIIETFRDVLSIKYHRNDSNLGIPLNFLQVVSMSEAEYSWLLGDDDLLLPNTFSEVKKLIDANRGIDLFYINSYHLTTEYVFSFPQPFDTSNLPKSMKKFSLYEREGQLPFHGLVNPKISFDFLGGMFLSVFRTAKWNAFKHVLNENALHDKRTFSHFDNTFPHLKIFINAFKNSNAYFKPEPLSVCLTGAREWSPMYPLIHSVRLPEALDEYRKTGLPLFQYLRCKNYALDNFIPEMCAMFVQKKKSGYAYVSPLVLYLKNILYPNTHLSLIYFLIRKLRKIFGGSPAINN
jgi:glycosyltransferase involved in cell wall biosynthesis